MAPDDKPTAAMMNENSPIWARLMPARIDVGTLYPVRNEAVLTTTTLPTITSSVKTRTATQWSAISAGLINMPTATKKIAANRSRAGWMIFSTVCATPDSAASAPAMNAPSATE